MRKTQTIWLTAGSAVVIGIGFFAAVNGWFGADDSGAIAIDADDVAGVVTGADGPEAGVWVIAETTDLPTKFARIVVTDDRGRYVLPDLPAAIYDVWVRGYGLIDSQKIQTSPGNMLDLTAVPAPSAAAAAEYYPAIYWYAMLGIPDQSEFPGTGLGPGGNGISEDVVDQKNWLQLVKIDGCQSCHQIGNKATRTFPPELGPFESSYQAWERRIQSGQASANMIRDANWLGAERILTLLADWTDRIAAGQLPQSQPPRPAGVERNIVVTLWDWANATTYIDDQNSADRRNPTYNAYGPIWGAVEASSDFIPILDPQTHTASEVKIPVRDPNTPTTRDDPIFRPSPYWGDERIWDSQGNTRHAMHDEKGRIWVTTRIRGPQNPEFCREGSDHPSAANFPLEQSTRQLSYFDLETGEFTLIDTCFTTHHMYYDANGILWLSGDSDVVGWFDTNIFDETGDEQAAQGWTPVIVDTNGNGARDAFVEPDDAVDPARDKRFTAGYYAVSVNPVDGTIWGTVRGYPGAIVRLDPGADPSSTAMAEIYELPWNDPDIPGYSPRGIDVDNDGVAWVSMISGHLGSFDRRKCTGPLAGPNATGAQCPEGWTLHPFPGPQFEDIADVGSAESGYYTYVDRFNTFGLGAGVPINTANISDALVALVDGEFVTLRVPYPIGFYAKALDGRIDDPDAGWKGRGLWSAYSARPVHHFEGGKGTTSKVVHFQLRPDPLAH